MWKLEGIYAPAPAVFTDDGKYLDKDKMAENVKFWNGTGLSGIVVMGSNGEFVFLNPEEKREMIDLVCQNIGPEKSVIAGTGCETTRDTIELCEYAAKAGAKAALVISPNYYKKAMQTDRVIQAFYTEVADQSPIPVVLYNMPGNSGINLSSAIVAALAKHPNIIGVKDSGGNIVQIMEIIRDTPEDFAVFAGSASFLFPTIAAGGAGGTLALANVLPDECVKLYELSKAGETERASRLQLALIEANTAVTGRWGIPGLKAAMEMVGCSGGTPRKPLLPMPEEDRAKLKFIIEDAKRKAADI
ncbi:dihydrodipicolinate synthase family protein [Clostridium sp. AM58-1XD]|uniref:dihydrodipicolinate synthase family protein n=1 Tax=Clostridium sp. AM58-1XD TaxID=2292307 RepID=UPI000E543E69|nr:dihydrodipicolinate synthase family protein [Clostridium sp. AM58-1XD]RGY98367.1 dihydrodipicolinate synthase family protein [Clostridium sp. AM58-1XD]